MIDVLDAAHLLDFLQNASALAVLAIAYSLILRWSPTGRNLMLGLAFGLGAMFGGFAGAFFATRQGFISPESFTFIESAIILAIVVLGGMGSQIGVVLAAAVLIVLPELGRALEQFRMLVFGGAMVAIMVWRPRGLLAYREPTIVLQGRRRGGRS